MKVREFPKQEPRVESGPIRFGDDWTGLFLRGDSAITYGMYLRTYLQLHEDKNDIYFHILMGFAESLGGADEKLHEQSQME